DHHEDKDRRRVGRHRSEDREHAPSRGDTARLCDCFKHTSPSAASCRVSVRRVIVILGRLSPSTPARSPKFREGRIPGRARRNTNPLAYRAHNGQFRRQFGLPLGLCFLSTSFAATPTIRSISTVGISSSFLSWRPTSVAGSGAGRN